ncbi:hypothetical protein M7I_1678 [Glarea lozoyensis 74030]|uniref:Uncharacterized protein n=1 Tax=Glarea lozoyensis (strain ATCC 74030 / MF5533) TaxID=1104152 RepID=H0EGQ9_GLAL7|nr:hypothetical protein M7I_1678 [Glarea lozoyensis 74030]
MDRNVELTVEDILSIHRHWVTKLYVQDHKTEEDIVSLLHEARLPVTHSNPSRSDVHTIATPCNNSPSLLTKVTSHQTKTRSYEVEKTLSIFSKGPSPLDLFASSMQSHECIAVGLRRIKIEYPNDTSFDHDDEFEWMRQFKEYKTFNTERREVRILQDGDEA